MSSGALPPTKRFKRRTTQTLEDIQLENSNSEISSDHHIPRREASNNVDCIISGSYNNKRKKTKKKSIMPRHADSSVQCAIWAKNERCDQMKIKGTTEEDRPRTRAGTKMEEREKKGSTTHTVQQWASPFPSATAPECDDDDDDDDDDDGGGGGGGGATTTTMTVLDDDDENVTTPPYIFRRGRPTCSHDKNRNRRNLASHPELETDVERSDEYKLSTTRTGANRFKKARYDSSPAPSTAVAASPKCLAVYTDDTMHVNDNHQAIVTSHNESFRKVNKKSKGKIQQASKKAKTSKQQRPRIASNNKDHTVRGSLLESNPSMGEMTTKKKERDRGDIQVVNKEGCTSRLNTKNNLSGVTHHRSLPSSTTPEVWIQWPGPDDILMGRGRPYQNYVGNRKMVQFVEQFRKMYDETPREKRRAVGETIVDKILKTGARFLRKVGEQNSKMIHHQSKLTHDSVEAPSSCCHYETNSTRLKQSDVSPSIALAKAGVKIRSVSSIGDDGNSGVDDNRKRGDLQEGTVTGMDDNSTAIFWTEVSRETAFEKVTHVIRGKRRDTKEKKDADRSNKGYKKKKEEKIQNLTSETASARLSDTIAPRLKAAEIRSSHRKTDKKNLKTKIDENTSVVDHEGGDGHSLLQLPVTEDETQQNDSEPEALTPRQLRGGGGLSVPSHHDLPLQNVATSDILLGSFQPHLPLFPNGTSNLVQNGIEAELRRIVEQQLQANRQVQLQNNNDNGTTAGALRTLFAAELMRERTPQSNSVLQDEIMGAILSANNRNGGSLDRMMMVHQLQQHQSNLKKWNELVHHAQEQGLSNQFGVQHPANGNQHTNSIPHHHHQQQDHGEERGRFVSPPSNDVTQSTSSTSLLLAAAMATIEHNQRRNQHQESMFRPPAAGGAAIQQHHDTPHSSLSWMAAAGRRRDHMLETSPPPAIHRHPSSSSSWTTMPSFASPSPAVMMHPPSSMEEEARRGRSATSIASTAVAASVQSFLTRNTIGGREVNDHIHHDRLFGADTSRLTQGPQTDDLTQRRNVVEQAVYYLLQILGEGQIPTRNVS